MHVEGRMLGQPVANAGFRGGELLRRPMQDRLGRDHMIDSNEELRELSARCYPWIVEITVPSAMF